MPALFRALGFALVRCTTLSSNAKLTYNDDSATRFPPASIKKTWYFEDIVIQSTHQSSQAPLVLGGFLQDCESGPGNFWLVAVELSHQRLDAPLFRTRVV